jgi:hypothetical protein
MRYLLLVLLLAACSKTQTQVKAQCEADVKALPAAAYLASTTNLNALAEFICLDEELIRNYAPGRVAKTVARMTAEAKDAGDL